MALLRSKTDLLNDYKTICAHIHETQEPVYITNEEGAADTVLLSAEAYRKLTEQSALQHFLTDAAQKIAADGKHPEVDVLAELEKQGV